MGFFLSCLFFSPVSATSIFALFSLFFTFRFFYLDVSLNATTFPPLSFPVHENHEKNGNREILQPIFSVFGLSLFRRRDKSFQRAKLCKLFMERQIRRRFSLVRMETAIRERVTPMFFSSLIEKGARGSIFVPLLCFSSFFIILFLSFPIFIYRIIFLITSCPFLGVAFF